MNQVETLHSPSGNASRKQVRRHSLAHPRAQIANRFAFQIDSEISLSFHPLFGFASCDFEALVLVVALVANLRASALTSAQPAQKSTYITLKSCSRTLLRWPNSCLRGLVDLSFARQLPNGHLLVALLRALLVVRCRADGKAERQLHVAIAAQASQKRGMVPVHVGLVAWTPNQTNHTALAVAGHEPLACDARAYQECVVGKPSVTGEEAFAFGWVLKFGQAGVIMS